MKDSGTKQDANGNDFADGNNPVHQEKTHGKMPEMHA
jgi:hypothetical protein